MKSLLRRASWLLISHRGARILVGRTRHQRICQDRTNSRDAGHQSCVWQPSWGREFARLWLFVSGELLVADNRLPVGNELWLSAVHDGRIYVIEALVLVSAVHEAPR